jgi:hypothetical protein
MPFDTVGKHTDVAASHRDDAIFDVAGKLIHGFAAHVAGAEVAYDLEDRGTNFDVDPASEANSRFEVDVV